MQKSFSILLILKHLLQKDIIYSKKRKMHAQLKKNYNILKLLVVSIKKNAQV